MALYNELYNDWNLLFDQLLSLDKWSKINLQTADELGRTVLDYYKELEISLNQQRSITAEREKEIIYLNKCKKTLLEVHDSCLKDNELLEIGMRNLECTNRRLLAENTIDKKYIKELLQNIETIELRCDEFNKQLNEAQQKLTIEIQKNKNMKQEINENTTTNIEIHLSTLKDKSIMNDSIFNNSQSGYKSNITPPENCSFVFDTSLQQKNANSTVISEIDIENDQIIKLINKLEMTEDSLKAEIKRAADLERQLTEIKQENSILTDAFCKKSEICTSIHNELSNALDMNHSQMCSHCRRNNDNDNDDDDDDDDIVSSSNGSLSNKAAEITQRCRPTESSSGYSDEASNKYAPIYNRTTGHFLCSIGDGVNYKFSIYNDINSININCGKRAEYQEIYENLVDILKKVAENCKEQQETKENKADNTYQNILNTKILSKNTIPSIVIDEVLFISSATIKLNNKNVKKCNIKRNQQQLNLTSLVNSTVNLLAPNTKQTTESATEVILPKCDTLTTITVSVGFKKRNSQIKVTE